jgi:tartrate/fumarate subfamily iron-sulfur-dependent hydro-lyase alpha chain
MGGSRLLTEEEITGAVEALAGRASIDLPPDVENRLHGALDSEFQPQARYMLEMMLENARIAREENLPLCQDTGFFHLFISLGAGTSLPAGFQKAADAGLARATRKSFLRSSIVDGPLSERRNRGDNTPISIHIDSDGPQGGARFTVMAKGGGSENATRLHMLLPGAGTPGLKQAVMEAVIARAAYACPPLVVSVGCGSDAPGCIELALKGLLRPLGTRSEKGYLAELEQELMSDINRTGIGASALGGDITALDVHIEEAPTHIACLPVGIVLCCHSLRRASREV